MDIASKICTGMVTSQLPGIYLKKHNIHFDAEANDVATCVNDGEWWLACVLDVDSDNAEVKVTVLHLHGPTRLFKYPSLPDILTVSVSNYYYN